MAGDGEICPGTILAGKYRVDRVLGSGGMGVVVAAHHLQLDERVAIKTLLPHMLAHTEAVERFVREARAAVKIKSEHVARVSDVGTLDSGAPYMVMEFLSGEDLANWVANRGALPVEQAVDFVLQACDALAEAHRLGIVHRDLKPANLFCIRRTDGLLAVKVLDFGISKVSGLAGDEMGMTKTSAVMGSPYYMAPEQMASAKNADPQCDIWSLGAVLFELLVGRVPFLAETLPELVLKVANSPAPDVGEFRSDVPEGLCATVRRCLEREKSKRFSNVAELAMALYEYGPPQRARAAAERITRILQVSGTPQNPTLGPVPSFDQFSSDQLPSNGLVATIAAVAGPDKTLDGLGRTTGRSRSSSRTGLLAVLVGLLVVGGAVAMLLSAEQSGELAADDPPGTTTAQAAGFPDVGRDDIPGEAPTSVTQAAEPATPGSSIAQPPEAPQQAPAPSAPVRQVEPSPRAATVGKTSGVTARTQAISKTATPLTSTTADSPSPGVTEPKRAPSSLGGRL